MSHYPVIIIGGGPVGLTMALCLAQQGIRSTVIEKHPHTTNHPKARGVNGRSMEIFRQFGLEDNLQQYKMPKEANGFTWLEDFHGKEITRVEDTIDYSQYSPTTRAVIAQDSVEHELFKKAGDNALIDIRFNTLMTDTQQNDELVTVSLTDRNTQQSYKLTSDYIIAADGAYSQLRKIFDVKMQGVENLGEFCNIYCEMNLDKYVADRPSVGYMFIREDILGTFMLAKAGLQRWLVGAKIIKELGQTKETFTDDYCIKLVKKIINDDSVNVTLINKGFWTMAALIAEKYQVGRVFFVGDAAHRFPPTGGFGMNTGIQDAHNLAWKIAMVLNRQANESLLSTYESERFPVAYTNIKWSNKNADRFNTIYTALAEKDFDTFKSAVADQSNHINNINLDLGFIYGQDYIDNEFSKQIAVVGGRAPHCWIEKQGQTISTLDLFIDKFTLLCSPEASQWQNQFQHQSHLPCQIITIGEGGDFDNGNSDFLSLYGLSKTGAVLVRPDGHVAWLSTDDNTTFDYYL